MNEITLLKNDINRIVSDIEWLKEFYNFLQGVVPDNIYFRHGAKPKLSTKKAFSVIYYLQEHLSVFPDHVEVC